MKSSRAVVANSIRIVRWEISANQSFEQTSECSFNFCKISLAFFEIHRSVCHMSEVESRSDSSTAANTFKTLSLTHVNFIRLSSEKDVDIRHKTGVYSLFHDSNEAFKNKKLSQIYCLFFFKCRRRQSRPQTY